MSIKARNKTTSRRLRKNSEASTSYAEIDKEVKQAIVNANTSYEKYTLLETDVDKFTEALRQMEEKYSTGAATYYDYQTAVSNLFQAEVQRLQAKYEYIFRTKIIEFYSGNPID